MSDSLAFISSVDFITPPVDDPVWFGRIGAANALSDIYAMGGRPITALNLVMFPIKKLGSEVLKEVLRGGYEKVAEAGASLAGGHSVDDEEPKYGLAVTGVVSPDRVFTNRGVRAGDVLILSKPIGTGVLFNARRAKKLPPVEVDLILPQVAALNKTALEAALNFDVHACTDITGFGLLGHALEMARASGVRIDIRYDRLCFYPNALEMYKRGVTTGSNAANRKLVQEELEIMARLSREREEILFDPQTSGGLLLSVPSDEADPLIRALHSAGLSYSRQIGEASEGVPGVRVV